MSMVIALCSGEYRDISAFTMLISAHIEHVARCTHTSFSYIFISIRYNALTQNADARVAAYTNCVARLLACSQLVRARRSE